MLPRALQEVLTSSGTVHNEVSHFVDSSGCNRDVRFRYFCCFFPPPPLTSQGKGCISGALRASCCSALDSELQLCLHGFDKHTLPTKVFPWVLCSQSVRSSRCVCSASIANPRSEDCDLAASPLNPGVNQWQLPPQSIRMRQTENAELQHLCWACKLRVVEALRPETFVSLWNCILNPCALHSHPFRLSQRNLSDTQAFCATEAKHDKLDGGETALSADAYTRLYELYVRLVLSVAEAHMELHKGGIHLVDWLPSALLGRALLCLRSAKSQGDDSGRAACRGAAVFCLEKACGCWVEQPCLFPAVFQVDGRVQISPSLPYRGQLIHSFDAASAAPAAALRVAPGHRVLDLCCAPGNKLMLLAAAATPPSAALSLLSNLGQEATYLARDKMAVGKGSHGEEWGFVVGVDSSRSRLELCRRLLRRNGCRNALLILRDARGFGSASCCTCPKSGEASEKMESAIEVAETPQARAVRGKGRLSLRKMRRREEAHAVPLLEISDQGGASDNTHLSFTSSEGFDRVLLDVQCTHDASSRHIKKLMGRMRPTLRKEGVRLVELHRPATPSSQREFVTDPSDEDPLNDASVESREISLAEVHALQRQLLLTAFELLRPGGILVYSSCSLDSRQNEGAIEYLLEREPSALLFPIPCKMLNQDRSWPQIKGGGWGASPPKGFSESWCSRLGSKCRGFPDAYAFLEAHAIWPAAPSSLESKQLRRSPYCWSACTGKDASMDTPRPASCYFSGKEGITNGQFLCCIQKADVVRK